MFLLTWPVDLAVAAESVGLIGVAPPMPVVVLVGFGFVVASVVMSYVTGGKTAAIALLRRFLIWRVNWRWYAAILLIPALNYAAVHLYAALSGVPPDYSDLLAYDIAGSPVNLWAFMIPWFIFSGLTNLEEIGWRGYVLPRLQGRHDALTASIIVAVFWWLWHFPKYLVGGFDVLFLWTVVDVAAKAIMLTWLYNNTRGSLLLATMFHAAMNTAAVVLPIANTAITSHRGAFVTSGFLELVVALAIVAGYGRERLSRSSQPQVV